MAAGPRGVTSTVLQGHGCWMNKNFFHLCASVVCTGITVQGAATPHHPVPLEGEHEFYYPLIAMQQAAAVLLNKAAQQPLLV